MDFVRFLAEGLQTHPEPGNLSAESLGAMMEIAAAQTLNAVGQGYPVVDTLTRNQIGAVIAALMINQNKHLKRMVQNGKAQEKK